MRLVLIALVVYAAVYIGIRSVYLAPDAQGGPGTVMYPPDMFWLAALMWPAAEADRTLTGTASEVIQQRDIRDVIR